MKDIIVTGCYTPKKKRKVIKISESLGFRNERGWNDPKIYDSAYSNVYLFHGVKTSNLHKHISTGYKEITYKKYIKKYKLKTRKKYTIKLTQYHLDGDKLDTEDCTGYRAFHDAVPNKVKEKNPIKDGWLDIHDYYHNWGVFSQKTGDPVSMMDTAKPGMRVYFQRLD